MAKEKLVKAITSMDEDFAQWYTDIVKKADLIEYSSVKGFLVIRPYGYAIWENIQRILDGMFKKSGHENVYMPLLIPESLLKKEKDHVEGFAPEVAWVTHGGEEKLGERYCIRPTSETLFCEHYKNVIHSYRDLPKLYNQWCSVVRWEKTTRPFLRSREFLWQEGHTMHETAKDAQEETLRMLSTYKEFIENYLSIPVIEGRKTDKEKFAGATATYTVEALMHDGKALQSATSHNFGNGFAKAFGIEFSDKNNEICNPYQTSWGISTRIIGAIIMTHGDDNGLILPPPVAPIQVVIVPVAMHKEGVLDKATEIYDSLKEKFRIKLDSSDESAGWKFAEYEMKGVPVRLEIGPRDIENGVCVLARRDTGEKITVNICDAENEIENLLKDISENLYKKALLRRESMTSMTEDKEEFKNFAETKPGFIKAYWCGSRECEEKIKEEFDITSRCIVEDLNEDTEHKCIYCGNKAKHLVYWGKAY